LLEDVVLLAHVNEVPIAQIAEELGSAGGMLSPDRIVEIVNEHLTGDEAKAVARIIANVTPAEIPNVLRSLQDWSRLLPGELLAPSTSTIGKAGGNLNVLVQDYPALRLMHKAQRLVRQIGNELQSAVFICDLRPVYNEDHTEVVGFVPLVNMQLGYSKQNGNEDVLEATLTGDELRQFLGRGHDALNKLRILENMLDGPSETEDAS
jgi:hypothetical protein